uniref:Uncharacterized protein n=1 Tax=Ananas comosus var. bracteatus TaxID=296719 RepID=A0A6V7QPZ0_ANACO|nr:unnamed protein product [Ananas comosus var. bracteatus]
MCLKLDLAFHHTLHLHLFFTVGLRGSSHPLSLPSQPLDIRNWFSSYEYESEETSDSFRDADASETQDPVEVLRKRKPEDPTTYTCLSSEQHIDLLPNKKNFDYSRDGQDDCSNCDRSTATGEYVKKLTRSPIKMLRRTNFREEISLEEYPKEATISTLNYGTVSELAHDLPREEESLTRDGRSNAETFSGNSSFPRDLSHMPSNRESKAKRKQILRVILFGEDFLGNSAEAVVDDMPASPKRERGKIEDELGGKDQRSAGVRPAQSEIKQREENNASNDFISTKNRESSRQNDGIHVQHSVATSDHKNMATENEMKGKDEPSMNRGNLKRDDSGKGIVRSPLGDRTNFQIENAVAAAPTVPDLSGKWRCPRKSRPYTGPPMKQLRLERWVHRKI